jgi:hypothetical protein
MEQWGIPITIVSGPVTDNQTGTEYVSQEMKLPAANAKTDGRALFGVVYDEIHKDDRAKPEDTEITAEQEIRK